MFSIFFIFHFCMPLTESSHRLLFQFKDFIHDRNMCISSHDIKETFGAEGYCTHRKKQKGTHSYSQNEGSGVAFSLNFSRPLFHARCAGFVLTS